GFTPMAMLWRPETPSQMKWMPEESWRAFQRQWARPGIIHAREVVPYGKSPLARARVKAARSAQRDDAADLRNLRPAHRPKQAETVYNGDRVVNTSGRPVGNSRAYALRRLRHQRPDIHARVLAGEISPHAGMIEAGFRKRRQQQKGSLAVPYALRLCVVFSRAWSAVAIAFAASSEPQAARKVGL